jgi:hypothetical protein
MLIDPAIQLTAAYAIAAVFAISAAMKLSAPAEFAAAVENYRIVPAELAWPIAIAIPAFECAIAVGLTLAVSRTIASLGAIAMLGAFSVAIAINLARGRVHIDCGCFGPALRQELSWWLVGRNAILASGAALAAYPAVGRTVMGLDVFTAVAGAAMLVVLYGAANVISVNMPRTRALEYGDA